MATTVHEAPRIDQQRQPRGVFDSCGGGRGTLTPVEGRLHSLQYAPPPASTGVWVAIAAIGMTFAALTSALIVRRGGAADWRHFTIPSILYVNTILLIASSLTLEISRRGIADFMGSVKGNRNRPAFWLDVALGLGLVFVAGQYIAWRHLSTQGVYLASNPSSSFFYVLTAAHALHVLGGVGGLIRIVRKFHNFSLRRSTLDATSCYWHFMGVLWIYLLLLMWAKL